MPDIGTGKAISSFSDRAEEPNLPENWKYTPLGAVVEVYDKQRIPLSESQRQKRKGQYPYCGANGVLDHIDNYLFDGEFVLLAEDGGYWGPFQQSAYLMRGRFWVNNHAHVLHVLDGLADSYFLVCFLNWMDLSGFIGGTTRGKLTQGVMRQIAVPMPSVNEQRRIARLLSTIQQAIEAQDKIIAAGRELKAIADAAPVHVRASAYRPSSSN